MCMFTGIAALLLPDGRTFHSSFGLPLEITDASTSSVSFSDEKAEVLRGTYVFIIDEASMVPQNVLRIIDLVLRDLSIVLAVFQSSAEKKTPGEYVHVTPENRWHPHGYCELREKVPKNCIWKDKTECYVKWW
ncbi:hypothetical protein L596_011122 [Steinernema carpocapsae]|uniref:ATP-dependent DNA helicase n=1 Tax=Steinernema carpocapsae TaxID=34508 RepID=A0A4U5NSK8_STECR|nr:hypothetical protein L596_011122 [Steinernema carpocapsae]